MKKLFLMTIFAPLLHAQVSVQGTSIQIGSHQGPPGCVVGTTCTGNLTPRTLNTVIYNSDTYLNGADLGARINLADADMTAHGVTSGVITVNVPATATTPWTLAVGHDLQINANVTQSTTGTLSGKNRVDCNGSSLITVTSGNAFNSIGDNITFDNCQLSGASGDAVALNTVASNHVKVTAITGTNIGVVHMNGGTDLSVSHSSVSGSATYGVVIQGGSYVTIDDLACDGIANCAEWFNHDAAFTAGGPTSRATVTSLGAGNYLFNNIRCHNVVACAWGSVGYSVVVSNSLAVNCGDVCFDAEGSMDVNFSSDTASGGVNGDGTVFFFSDNVQFNNPNFSNAGALVRIFNSSGIPANSNYMQVNGGLLDCGTVSVCSGVIGDAWNELSISNVRFRNATIIALTQGSTTRIFGNKITFTVNPGAAFNAINIPNRINNALVDIENNQIEAFGGAAAGSIGIALTTSDFNSTQTFRILNNYIGAFPLDISTTNSGTNGGTGLRTLMDGNFTEANNVVHSHPTGNLDTYTVLSQYIFGSGGVWKKIFPILAGTGIRLTCSNADGSQSPGTTTTCP